MHKFGHVCLIGRPNVGKSTLTNRFLKVPLAIESEKPQTTWYAVAGMVKHEKSKFVLTDTPGIHQFIHRQQNQTMNRIAYSALSQADIICHLITPKTWKEEDQHIYDFIQNIDKPKILLVNKVDQFSTNTLLPFISSLQDKNYHSILSISAKEETNLDLLLDEITSHLKPRIPTDKITIADPSEAFLAQEMLREQLMQRLQSEIPYTTFIEVFHTKQHPKALEIHANLHVKHIGQKKMLIGRNAQQVKEIGQFARKRLQVILKKRIILKVWVKISTNNSGKQYIDS